MGAPEEIVCWCLLKVVGGGKLQAGPYQWGKDTKLSGKGDR